MLQLRKLSKVDTSLSLHTLDLLLDFIRSLHMPSHDQLVVEDDTHRCAVALTEGRLSRGVGLVIPALHCIVVELGRLVDVPSLGRFVVLCALLWVIWCLPEWREVYELNRRVDESVSLILREPPVVAIDSAVTDSCNRRPEILWLGLLWNRCTSAYEGERDRCRTRDADRY